LKWKLDGTKSKINKEKPERTPATTAVVANSSCISMFQYINISLPFIPHAQRFSSFYFIQRADEEKKIEGATTTTTECTVGRERNHHNSNIRREKKRN
jgi:hypothetical protein